MMPPQLARGAKRRRSRHSEPPPTVELLPAININDLRHGIPLDYSTNVYSNSFRYPQVRHIRLSCRRIEIVDHFDRVQVFGSPMISMPLSTFCTHFSSFSFCLYRKSCETNIFAGFCRPRKSKRLQLRNWVRAHGTPLWRVGGSRLS
jgi:hypothetical protein